MSVKKERKRIFKKRKRLFKRRGHARLHNMHEGGRGGAWESCDSRAEATAAGDRVGKAVGREASEEQLLSPSHPIPSLIKSKTTETRVKQREARLLYCFSRSSHARMQDEETAASDGLSPCILARRAALSLSPACVLCPLVFRSTSLTITQACILSPAYSVSDDS